MPKAKRKLRAPGKYPKGIVHAAQHLGVSLGTMHAIAQGRWPRVVKSGGPVSPEYLRRYRAYLAQFQRRTPAMP
jgi:hypothetical protein